MAAEQLSSDFAKVSESLSTLPEHTANVIDKLMYLAFGLLALWLLCGSVDKGRKYFEKINLKKMLVTIHILKFLFAALFLIYSYIIISSNRV